MSYIAYWEDSGVAIYVDEPYGNLYGALPLGAVPADDPSSTLHLSGPAAWDHAVFVTPSGRRIIVEPLTVS